MKMQIDPPQNTEVPKTDQRRLTMLIAGLLLAYWVGANWPDIKIGFGDGYEAQIANKP